MRRTSPVVRLYELLRLVQISLCITDTPETFAAMPSLLFPLELGLPSLTHAATMSPGWTTYWLLFGSANMLQLKVMLLLVIDGAVNSDPGTRV